MFDVLGRRLASSARLVVVVGVVLAGLGLAFPAPRATAAPTHVLTDLGVFGSVLSFPVDINEQGHYLFTAEIEDSSGGFVWQDGRVTELMAPPGFASRSVTVRGINDRGQVVGSGYTSVEVPLLWDNGTAVQLETVAGQPAQASAINNAGQIAGTIGNALGIWQNGVITQRIEHEGFLSVEAINDGGQVVGQLYDTVSGQYRAYLWHNGTFMLLPHVPSAIQSYATDINKRGEIVGQIRTGADANAVLWHNGTATVLPPPAGLGGGAADGINDEGQIVGFMTGKAVLWHNGAAIELGVFEDDTGSSAKAINNRGQIAGASGGGTRYPNTHTVMWNPNPNATVLSNGGFESDTNNDKTPDDWSAAALAERSSAAKRLGNTSLRLQATGNRDFEVWQPVYGVRSHAAFDVGGWVNIPRTSDRFTFSITVAWKDKVGNELRVDTVSSWSGATSGWKQGAKQLTAPANTDRAVVRLSVRSLAATIYVDDVVFKAR